jgi:hypothetical protein
MKRRKVMIGEDCDLDSPVRSMLKTPGPARKKPAPKTPAPKRPAPKKPAPRNPAPKNPATKRPVRQLSTP